jgi:NAD(P)-dependent dehydrogenase (short-subunit alcohol dehydrogenase family)
VAVVTGASRGIGRAVAHRLAADGLDVVAVGRDEAALKETAAADEARIATLVCDVTDEEQVVERIGGLPAVDVLVNNAGAASSERLDRTSLADWDALLRVNATGPFLCTRAVLTGMRERGWGRVVTVASIAGLTGGPYIAAYTASKHAAVGLMRAVAAEVRGTGVTANSVCPGYVRTEMTDRTIATIVGRTGRTPEQAAAALGTILEPEAVAGAVAFLAGDGAASVNGREIVLDG